MFQQNTFGDPPLSYPRVRVSCRKILGSSGNVLFSKRSKRPTQSVSYPKGRNLNRFLLPFWLEFTNKIVSGFTRRSHTHFFYYFLPPSVFPCSVSSELVSPLIDPLSSVALRMRVAQVRAGRPPFPIILIYLFHFINSPVLILINGTSTARKSSGRLHFEIFTADLCAFMLWDTSIKLTSRPADRF